MPAGSAVSSIEEKTPKGISLKILINKGKFMAFDRKGSLIYSDEHGLKVMHPIYHIVFIGGNFRIKNNYTGDLSLLKVSRAKLVVPFARKDYTKNRYLFIHFSDRLDMIPVRLTGMSSATQLIALVESGKPPDFIVIDEDVPKTDHVVVRNRCPHAQVIVADAQSEITEIDRPFSVPVDAESERRATDMLRDVNLNVMSQNPVFLARVHLRNMDLAKVKQLLLDFDLTHVDTDYILNFINTMLSKADTIDELKREQANLESLRKAFQFYIHLIDKKEDEVRNMIASAQEPGELTLYHTLIAKLKLVFPEQKDQLLFTVYENMIWDHKEKLEKG